MADVLGTVEVPLELFSGLNQELAPQDLVQGVSSFCPNVAFLPGSVFTRPPLRRNIVLPGNKQIVYQASYLKPDGTYVQLLFDSNGDIFANGSKIGSTSPGCRFKSVTAFGKEWIAVTDGTQGAGVPLHFDGTYLDRVSQDGPGKGVTVTLGTIPAFTPSALTRTGNIVTATLSAPTTLVKGMQVEVANVADLSETITSIVINNETTPGLATLTTPTAHGFQPGVPVKIANVTPAALPAVQSWETYNAETQFTFATAHGLSVGDVIQAQVGTDSASYGQFAVQTVPSTTKVTFITNYGNASGGSGQSSAALVWVLASGSTVTIQDTPTTTTFTFPITASDGTWTSGNVQYAWNGTFQLYTVSGTTVTYRQIGPNATAAAMTGMTITVTPKGQMAPGLHKVVQIFLTRSGYLTVPSPPVSFQMSGNQYPTVSVLTGPSNVVARWLAFTPANGDSWRVLPVPPVLPGGDPYGTSSIINDNVTTSAVFDFSDQALLDGLAIDRPGNNLFQQRVLGGVLGFYPEYSRLFAWGEDNKIDQFYNMGFAGGTNPNNALDIPGWTVTGTATLGTGIYGTGLVLNGTISQTAYQDYLGVAILQPNTQYLAKGWFKGAGSVTVQFYSPTAGVLASANVVATANGSFQSVALSAKTPLVIPADTMIEYIATGDTIDELRIVYAAQPIRPYASGSYVINPEAFDSVTGNIGPASDPHPIISMFTRRGVLHVLTQGPDGRLHEASDTSSSEPSGWDVNEVATKCGGISVWGDAQFEDWHVWASDTGLRMYDGGTVEKLSQEVQPWWDSFTQAAKTVVFVANDPYTRRMYVGAPCDGAVVPNTLYALDYRELNTASALQQSGPLKVSYSGKVFTTDLTRKWSPWTMTMNYASLIKSQGNAQMGFCCGSGGSLQDPSYGTVYTLAEGVQLDVDDDYGNFDDRYRTYQFVQPSEAQQMQLGLHRRLAVYATISVTGIGNFVLQPYVGSSEQLWPTCRPIPLGNGDYDLEIPLNISGDRIAFEFACADSNTPTGWRLDGFIVALRTHPSTPIRGSNNG